MEKMPDADAPTMLVLGAARAGCSASMQARINKRENAAGLNLRHSLWNSLS
jgi:hypothetical protein